MKEQMVTGNSNSGRVALIISVLIILFPLGYSIISLAVLRSPAHSQPFLEKTDEKFKDCVKDSVYMRYKHMDYLKELRDKVVRNGEKVDVELNDCWKCHKGRENFCNKCHNAVSLQPDCFRCHYEPEAGSNNQM